MDLSALKLTRKTTILAVLAFVFFSVAALSVGLHFLSGRLRQPAELEPIIQVNKPTNASQSGSVVVDASGLFHKVQGMADAVRSHLPVILMVVVLLVVMVTFALIVYYLSQAEPIVPDVPERRLVPKKPSSKKRIEPTELIFGIAVVLVLLGGAYLYASRKPTVVQGERDVVDDLADLGRKGAKAPTVAKDKRIVGNKDEPVRRKPPAANDERVYDYQVELGLLTFDDPMDNAPQADPVGPLTSTDVELEEKRKRIRPGGGEMHDQAFSSVNTPFESSQLVIDSLHVPGAVNPGRYTAAALGAKREAVKDRFLGAMVGLAIADAYGSAYEFKTPSVIDKMKPGDSHQHNGVFSHRLGAWTDDTSMALCLLASAVESDRFDAEDVWRKYKAWFAKKQRYMNFDPKEEDFGTTTRNLLNSGKFNVVTQPSWGNAVIMRLAPVVLQYLFSDAKVAMRMVAASGGMTAGDQSALDFTATMAYIMRGFIKGTWSRKTVCAPDFVRSKLGWYFEEFPFGEHFKKTVSEWPKPLQSVKQADHMSSHIVFNRALYSFCTTDSFTDGLKKVVSFGHDTDTAAAVFGQIFGSYFGLRNAGKRKSLDGSVVVGGVQQGKLYGTTQRTDAISLLTELLWVKLIGDGARGKEVSAIIMKNDGKVRDLNPKYHIDGVKDVLNGETNLSTLPSQ